MDHGKSLFEVGFRFKCKKFGESLINRNSQSTWLTESPIVVWLEPELLPLEPFCKSDVYCIAESYIDEIVPFTFACSLKPI